MNFPALRTRDCAGRRRGKSCHSGFATRAGVARPAGYAWNERTSAKAKDPRLVAMILAAVATLHLLGGCDKNKSVADHGTVRRRDPQGDPVGVPGRATG